jgi:GWxTD domain-containing protein
MKPLEVLVHSTFAQTMGWTLLHSLWQAMVISLALSLVRSARIRYRAACLALLLSLTAFGATFLALASSDLPSSRAFQTTYFPAWRMAAVLSPNSLQHSLFTAAIPWLTPLWIVGALTLCVFHLAGRLELSRLRSTGVCTAPQQWQNSLARLAAAVQVSRPVQLLESCLVKTPVVLGHVRPVILLPLGLLSGLPAEHMEAILLHELAHIRRCDYLINTLQRLAEALCFYNPSIWWISHVIRVERENCCDDLVVAMQGDPRAYACALARLEENRSAIPLSALAASGGSLMKRIRRLLYPQRPAAWPSLVAVALLCITASAGVAAWRSQTAPDPNDDAAFTRWLNQDVVYIINDEERGAFLKLATSDEKQHFIEQFWLRRDPTPGTPKNEFKEEHYRRIAYANSHFATSRPGWQTDRGHIYILYGPPDEIDSHPHDAHAYEDWLYRHLDNVGNNVTMAFVDVNHTGDWRIAPGQAGK